MDTTTDVLNDRFEIVRQLGEGGQARTFLARDAETGGDVVVKELSFERADDWKSVELFEREAKALRNLDHPAIPDYIDAFHHDEEGRFFLVQQYIEGESLKERLDRGIIMDDQEVQDFLDEMLSILEYLHGFSPPVIHRDIKPSNIMVDADGSLALIDFGAVQVVAQDAVGGSTVVGTTGYMPPEQLMGRAQPATDVYALAATTVHLITGMHPADLPVERMKLDFRDIVGFRSPLLDVLDKMLGPEVANRYTTAREVREALEAPALEATDRPQSGRPASSGAPPTFRGPGLANRGALSSLAERAADPPVLEPISHVTVSGDSLVIDAQPETGSSLIPAVGAAVVGIGMIALSCATGVGELCCLGLPVLVVGVPLIIFGYRKFTGGALQRLELTPTALRLAEGKLDPQSGDLVADKDEHIPLAELRNCYLHVIDGATLSQANQQEGGMPKNMFQEPGIVFVDSRDLRYTFGKGVLTRGKLIKVGTHDTTEIRWLYDIVQQYLQEQTEPTDDDAEVSEPPPAKDTDAVW